MWTGFPHYSQGYAENLRKQIEVNASEYTLIHPYDILCLRNQIQNLHGVTLHEHMLTVELNAFQPRGFGNYFVTELITTPSLTPSKLEFRNPYPDEEFLGYSINGEDGYLLTETGELIVVA